MAMHELAKVVAFGPSESWVVSGHNDIDWSLRMPELYNLLNGRYCSQQSNSLIQTLAMTNDAFVIGYNDGSSRWSSRLDDVLSQALFGLQGGLKTFSFGDGDGDSYYGLSRTGSQIWRGIPSRMEELIHTRQQFSVTWGAIGADDAWFLKFNDGTIYWGGNIHDSLDERLNEFPDCKILSLSPFNTNYYIKNESGSSEWAHGGVALSNSLKSTTTLDAKEIYYTHSSIGEEFSCGRSIYDVFNDLREGDVSPRDIPAMRVLKCQGCYYSLDNRRLWCFTRANSKNIPVIVEEAADSFTRKVQNGYLGGGRERERGDGRTILVRGENKYNAEDNDSYNDSYSDNSYSDSNMDYDSDSDW